MNANQKIVACIAIGLLWLGALIALHFFPDLKDQIGQFTSACFTALVGLGAFHAGQASGGDGSSPAAAVQTPAPSAQAGFAHISFLLFVACAAAAAFVLGGCTTTTASMYSGLYTQAKAGIQVFDDSSLATMHDLICAQPYSAIQRHPEVQPGIVALCGPMVNTASLDPAQVTQMLGIARQLGVMAVAAPAAAASGAK